MFLAIWAGREVLFEFFNCTPFMYYLYKQSTLMDAYIEKLRNYR